jgi:hypothetical protein
LTEHISLRQRLAALIEPERPPVFETSDDPTLITFARIFVESELFALDANRHLRTDAFSPIFDCETESRTNATAEPVTFAVVWAPVWHRDDPETGFRTGSDSAFVGSTPSVAMPQDERTAALLLLVTTTFVHLSAGWDGGSLLVQGATEAENNSFRLLTMDPAVVNDLAKSPLH